VTGLDAMESVGWGDHGDRIRHGLTIRSAVPMGPWLYIRVLVKGRKTSSNPNTGVFASQKQRFRRFRVAGRTGPTAGRETAAAEHPCRVAFDDPERTQALSAAICADFSVAAAVSAALGAPWWAIIVVSSNGS